MVQIADHWNDFTLPDKYEMLDVLGEGGFGVVYKVHNKDMDRVEALKVVRFDRSDYPTFGVKKSFLREARIMDSLAEKSRYIVRVFELGALESSTPGVEGGYFSMEFVPGSTLKNEVLDRGPVRSDRAARFAAQVCSALEVAHTHRYRDQVGIVHRDLKLENVLRVDTAEGEEVRILDFGLSKVWAETGSTETAQFGAVATLGCAPPEQLGTEQLGPTADIFSLGVMLYELLTGHEPWHGRRLSQGRITAPETLQLFMLSAEEPAPKPMREFISADEARRVRKFEELIARCVRKRPQDRFQSAVDVRKVLVAIGASIDVRSEDSDHAARKVDARAQALDALYAEARRLGRAKDWQGVIDIFSKIEAEEPRFADPDGLLDAARQALAEEALEKELTLAESYAYGIRAVRASRWSEAIERLEAVVEIDLDYRDAASKLEEARQKQRLAELYSEARARRDEEDWDGVLDLLARIEAEDPTYRDADNLLALARDAQAAAKRKRELAERYDRGREAFEGESWTVAISQFETILDMEPAYRDVADKLREASVQQRLARLYAEARDLAAENEWAEVIDRLDRIATEDPDYSDAENLRAAAREGLEAENRRREIAGRYKEATAALESSSWPEAITHLSAVLELDPDHGDAKAKLAEAERQQGLSERYAEARELFRRGDWQGVVDQLARLEAEEPGYPDPEGLLDQAREALEASRRERKLERLYARATEALGAEDWPQAIELLEAVIELDADYREAASKLVDATRRRRLGDRYAEARRLHDAGDWQGVLGVLERIRRADPDYPDRDGLLDSATEAIQAHEREERLSGLYDRATEALDSASWDEAIGHLSELIALDADYRDASDLLERAVRSADEAARVEAEAAEAARIEAEAAEAARAEAEAAEAARIEAEALEAAHPLDAGESAITATSVIGPAAPTPQGPTPATRVFPGARERAKTKKDATGRRRALIAAGAALVLSVGGYALFGPGADTGAEGTTEGVEPPPTQGPPIGAPSVARITIEGAPASLAIGDRVTLAAAASAESGDPIDVETFEWTSGDPAIAVFDPGTGTLQGRREGSVEVTVRAGDVTASATISIVAPTGGLRVAILGDTRLRVGEAATLELDVSDPSIDPADARWSVADPAVAELRSNRLRGLAQGATTVVARLRDVQASRPVVVSGFLLSSIDIELPDELPAGASITARAVAYTSVGQADVEFAWTSSDPSIARIDPATGALTAEREGSVMITAGALRVAQSHELTVTAAEVAEISIGGAPGSVNVGDEVSLTSEARSSDGRAVDADLRWSTTPSGLARIDPGGRFTALAAGTVTITLSSADGRVTDSARITIENPTLGRAAIEGLLSTGLDECVQSIRSKDRARIAPVFSAAAADALEGLLDQARRRDFQARELAGTRNATVDRETASMSVIVETSWRGFAGAASTASWEVVMDASVSSGSWRLSGCRLVER